MANNDIKKPDFYISELERLMEDYKKFIQLKERISYSVETLVVISGLYNDNKRVPDFFSEPASLNGEDLGLHRRMDIGSWFNQLDSRWGKLDQVWEAKVVLANAFTMMERIPMMIELLKQIKNKESSND